jgi:hypothetical protein
MPFADRFGAEVANPSNSSRVVWDSLGAIQTTCFARPGAPPFGAQLLWLERTTRQMTKAQLYGAIVNKARFSRSQLESAKKESDFCRR